MALSVAYANKYRLWADVLRARSDRLVVSTQAELGLGSAVALQMGLPDLQVPVVLQATVVGLRPSSLRFKAGVYLHINDEEMDKARRMLGMALPRDPAAYGRRAVRAACDLTAHIQSPPMAGALRVRNLSLTGALVTSRAPVPRMPMDIQLTLDDGSTVKLSTDSTWQGTGALTAGIQFVNMPHSVEDRLRACVLRLGAAHALKDTHRRVVIADDDPDILHMLETVLTQHGYEAFRAHDGEEASEVIREVTPSIVLLDVLMPGIDGADICRMMRADVELAKVPVIFISALDEHTLLEMCEQSGASDFLTKPLALTDLINLVGRYLAASTLGPGR